MKGNREKTKLLLVDDLEENLLALEALLVQEDVELLKAMSGREALELLLAHEVALALIDVQMPEMDGFELAELMRGTERTRSIPIIFVTAGVRERHRVFQGYDVGAVDLLFKPIEPQILRRKVETFIELYRQKLELSNTLRLNEELMAVVGHDLRNPLNAILMTATALADRATDPETAKAARRLRSSGDRMVRIIDELFDLTRARLGGGIPIERAPADALAIAKRALGEFEASHPNQAFQLVHEGDLRGAWDASRIEQVLSNLVGNAVRHGDGSTPIVVSLVGHEASVVLSVKNAGHIPEDVLPRLFEPFQSGGGPRSRAQGLGLGLYIVEQIALAHRGSVNVRSTPDEGTTFFVHLPKK